MKNINKNAKLRWLSHLNPPSPARLLVESILIIFNHISTLNNHQLYYKTEKNQETTTRKKTTLFWKIQRSSLGPYDKIKKCSDCHPESSHTCKNSSRRTPRSKNLNFLFFVQITCFKLKAEGVGKQDAMVETATLRHCLGLKNKNAERDYEEETSWEVVQWRQDERFANTNMKLPSRVWGKINIALWNCLA